MKNPVVTTISMTKEHMAMLWGDASCFLSDMVIGLTGDLPELSPDTVSYQAYVTCTFTKAGDLATVHIDIAGEVVEPEEEIPSWVESEEAREEGHPENERNEARIASLFGIKKYG